MGLALTNDGLLVCCLSDPSAALYKFAQNGSMDELAAVPALADYGEGFKRCAVHQQTQRTYALREIDEGDHALVLFDANLQAIGTVEATGDVPEDFSHEEDYEPICDVAVHGDQVIVLAGNQHPKGSGLRLLDLDGRFLRTIAAGQFQKPHVVTASHGKAFVVDNHDEIARAIDDDDDDDDEEPGKVLHVIDIQSGDILQSVGFVLEGAASAILVDGNNIYIASFFASEVVVLQLAGSEA